MHSITNITNGTRVIDRWGKYTGTVVNVLAQTAKRSEMVLVLWDNGNQNIILPSNIKTLKPHSGQKGK